MECERGAAGTERFLPEGWGSDHFLGTFSLLDMTPLGRQDGPKGPAEFKLRYEYEE